MYPNQRVIRKAGEKADHAVLADFHREFPSLSNAPQTQHQNPGQAIWANANQRAVQPSSDQRPQQQNLRQNITQHHQSQNSHQGQDASQQTPADLFSNGSQFPGRFDDYRHGGQSGVGQLSSSTQPQPNSIDDFPPLGSGAPDDNGLDRRGNLIRSAAFDGFANANSYSGSSNTAPSQQIGSGQNNGASDGSRPTNLIDRVLSPGARPFAANASRSPGEAKRQHHENAAEPGKDGIPGTRSNSHSANTFFSSFQDSSMLSNQQGFPNIQSNSRNQPSSYGGGSHAQSSVATPEQPPSQMSEMDRWGLNSLLATMKGENPDATGLAVGQDLTQLGLNLNSPE